MKNIKLRNQKISDAKRFFEILNSPQFIYFPVKPKTIKEEIDFLKLNPEKRRKKLEFNYSIIYQNYLIGGIGLQINPNINYIAIIGYFIDDKFWNNGFATQALKKIERIGFNELNLVRIELAILPQNVASIKVAKKCGYKKEGLLKKRLYINKKYKDAFLFAKTK